MDQLTQCAIDGYNNPTAKNPHNWSSLCARAFTVGQRISRHLSTLDGLKVKPGRGHKMNVVAYNGKYTYDFAENEQFPVLHLF